MTIVNVEQLYYQYIHKLSVADKQRLVNLINQQLAKQPAKPDTKPKQLIPARLQVEPGKSAFILFRKISTKTELAQVVQKYPFMIEGDFIADLEQVVAQAANHERAKLQEHVIWLRQIARKRLQTRPEPIESQDLSLEQYQARLVEYNLGLQRFETQYGMSTQEFYQKFVRNELEDTTAFFEWSSLFELQQKLLEQIEQKLETKVPVLRPNR